MWCSQNRGAAVCDRAVLRIDPFLRIFIKLSMLERGSFFQSRVTATKMIQPNYVNTLP